MAAENKEAVLKKICDDEILSDFMVDDFDVQTYTSTVLHNSEISQRLAQLVDAISILDKELQSQISERHEDLLAQATGIESLEGILNMMQTRIVSLQSAVDRIRNCVTEPYAKMQTRTLQLERLQMTCDLLRRIIRILFLSKRLRSQLSGGAREIAKAAQSLSELDYLAKGVDLSGINVIERDLMFMSRARGEIENQATAILNQGFTSQNQTQIATALQVFYNLNDLNAPLVTLVDQNFKIVEEKFQSTLDVKAITQSIVEHQSVTNQPKGPGKASGLPTPGSSTAFRHKLWLGLEETMDYLCTITFQIVNVQRVLQKKRDPVTHAQFIEELQKHGCDAQYANQFWKRITTSIKNHLLGSIKVSSYMKQAFEGEYPKLLQMYNNTWKRLASHSGALDGKQNAFKDKNTLHDTKNEAEEKRTAVGAEELFKASLNTFENKYLQRSLSRLFDPVNLVFPQGAKTAPSEEEIENILKTIQSEIKVTKVDNDLANSVSKNIAKTVQYFSVKSEQLLSTLGEASQVIGMPNTSQKRNTNVINSLYLFQKSLSKTLIENECSEEAMVAIQQPNQELTTLMAAAIHPLISSVSDSVEAIILTMHNEDFSKSEETESYCSLYMKELQDFLNRVVKDHFLQYKCKDFVFEQLSTLGQRAIILFLRHAAMIRPLGDGGKSKLAADFAQLEVAINPLCKKVTDFGASYRLLRAFKPLLFVNNKSIGENQSLGDVIPFSLVLHFLFSKAPEDLKSPYEVMGWSIARYSRWLDEHTSEKERLNMLRGTVEKYVSSVRSNQGTSFAPVYPTMVLVLQKALES